MRYNDHPERNETMDNPNAFNRQYLPLLVEHYRLVEKEIETLESYITEENFNEYFQDYMTLQNTLTSALEEITRVGKALDMKRKQIRQLIQP